MTNDSARTMSDLADELRKLDEAATAGPWFVQFNEANPWDLQISADEAGDLRVAFMAHSNGKDDYRDGATATLICYLRNHVPEIIRALTAPVSASEGEVMKAAELLRAIAHDQPMVAERAMLKGIANDLLPRLSSRLTAVTAERDEAVKARIWLDGEWDSALAKFEAEKLRANTAESALLSSRAEGERIQAQSNEWQSAAELREHQLDEAARDRDELETRLTRDFNRDVIRIGTERDAALAELERVRKPVTAPEVAEIIKRLNSAHTAGTLPDRDHDTLTMAADLLSRLSSRAEAADSIHRTLVEGEIGPRELWDRVDIYNGHTIDIVTRKDAVEKRYEGDFLKKIAQIIRKGREPQRP